MRSNCSCSVDGCVTPTSRYVRGMCWAHYQQWYYEQRKTGIKPVRSTVSGSSHGNWKGGRNTGGKYVVVQVPEGWGHSRSQLEHRVVMERLLGRPLRKGENVHHRNGDKHDNRPENLELWIVPQPYGMRVADLVAMYSPEPEPELCMVMC